MLAEMGTSSKATAGCLMVNLRRWVVGHNIASTAALAGMSDFHSLFDCMLDSS